MEDCTQTQTLIQTPDLTTFSDFHFFLNTQKTYLLLSMLIVFVAFSANAQWKHDYYVDQFGDPTDQGYIGTIVNGTFSDDETANGELAASIRITHREGQYLTTFHMLKNKKGPAEPLKTFSLSIKNSFNDVVEYEGKNGVLIANPKANFVEFLKVEQTGLKFALVETSANNTKYSFTVDFDDFEEQLQQLSLSEEVSKDIELGGVYLGAQKTKRKTKTSYARIVGHVYAESLSNGVVYGTKFVPLGIMLTSGQQAEVLEFTNTKYGIDLEPTNTEAGALSTYTDTKYGATFMLSKTRASFTLEIKDVGLQGSKD